MTCYVSPKSYLLCALIKNIDNVDDYDYKYYKNLQSIFGKFQLPDDYPKDLFELFEECTHSEFESDDMKNFYDRLCTVDTNMGIEMIDVYIDGVPQIVVVPFANEYYNKYKIEVHSGDTLRSLFVDVNELNRVNTIHDPDMKACYDWFKKYNVNLEKDDFFFQWCLATNLRVRY